MSASAPITIDQLYSHVSAVDNNGRPFVIVINMSREPDFDVIYQDLDNHVKVIKSFVTAWNTGVPDCKNANPVGDITPVDFIRVSSSHHLSSYSPTERVHITIELATEAMWNAEPRVTKGTIHIYSKKDDTKFGIGMDIALTRKAIPPAWIQLQKAKQQAATQMAGNLAALTISAPGNAGTGSTQQAAKKKVVNPAQTAQPAAAAAAGHGTAAAAQQAAKKKGVNPVKTATSTAPGSGQKK